MPFSRRAANQNKNDLQHQDAKDTRNPMHSWRCHSLHAPTRHTTPGIHLYGTAARYRSQSFPYFFRHRLSTRPARCLPAGS